MNGERIETRFGFSPVALLEVLDFDYDQFKGWLDSTGRILDATLPVSWVSALAELLVLRAPRDCEFVAILPLSKNNLVAGAFVSAAEVSVIRNGKKTVFPIHLATCAMSSQLFVRRHMHTKFAREKRCRSST